MSTTTATPTGNWTVDPIHSTIGFTVNHSGFATFRSRFNDYEATLRDGVLTGSVKVESIDIGLDPFKQHMLAPEFFDAEQHPTLTFTSKSIELDGAGNATLAGELTIKGTTKPVTATGRYAGPATNLAGGQTFALDVSTTINRHEFGLTFDAKLDDGRNVVGDEVALDIALELSLEE